MGSQYVTVRENMDERLAFLPGRASQGAGAERAPGFFEYIVDGTTPTGGPMSSNVKPQGTASEEILLCFPRQADF